MRDPSADDTHGIQTVALANTKTPKKITTKPFLQQNRVNRNHTQTETAQPMTALMQAVKANKLDAVAQLLASGANVNQADGGGDWPVIMAAYLGHTAVLELLLQAGADLGVLDPGMKATALHAAAYAGRTEAARLLIRQYRHQQPGALQRLHRPARCRLAKQSGHRPGDPGGWSRCHDPLQQGPNAPRAGKGQPLQGTHRATRRGQLNRI